MMIKILKLMAWRVARGMPDRLEDEGWMVDGSGGWGGRQQITKKEKNTRKWGRK